MTIVQASNVGVHMSNILRAYGTDIADIGKLMRLSRDTRTYLGWCRNAFLKCIWGAVEVWGSAEMYG
jgi:hypothetical protein